MLAEIESETFKIHIFQLVNVFSYSVYLRQQYLTVSFLFTEVLSKIKNLLIIKYIKFIKVIQTLIYELLLSHLKSRQQ